MTELRTIDDPEVQQALREKMADVMGRGPALTKHDTIHAIARCPTGEHVLEGGLGAMGVGQMWFPANNELRADPAWEKLPIELCLQAPCPVPRLTPKEMADIAASSFARHGSRVRRWVLLVEDDDGLDSWFNEADREWAEREIKRLARETADKARNPPDAPQRK